MDDELRGAVSALRAGLTAAIRSLRAGRANMSIGIEGLASRVAVPAPELITTLEALNRQMRTAFDATIRQLDDAIHAEIGTLQGVYDVMAPSSRQRFLDGMAKLSIRQPDKEAIEDPNLPIDSARLATMSGVGLRLWGQEIVDIAPRRSPEDDRSLSESFLVTLADGTRLIYKPEINGEKLKHFQEEGVEREEAAYLIDRWLGFDMVPRTELWDGPNAPDAAIGGRGSVQLWVPETHRVSTITEYPVLDQRRVLLLDYLAASQDRHTHNHRRRRNRRPLAYDNAGCCPSDPRSAVIRSDFVVDGLGRDLPAEVVGPVWNPLEPLHRDLDHLLGAAAADGFASRVDEVRHRGRVTGEAWRGAGGTIVDAVWRPLVSSVTKGPVPLRVAMTHRDGRGVGGDPVPKWDAEFAWNPSSGVTFEAYSDVGQERGEHFLRTGGLAEVNPRHLHRDDHGVRAMLADGPMFMRALLVSRPASVTRFFDLTIGEPNVSAPPRLLRHNPAS